MTTDLSALCRAGKVFLSGATWCCNPPKGHAGNRDDGLGEQWSSVDPEQEPRATTADTYAGIPVRRGLFGCDDWQRMAEDLMAFQDAVQEALGTEDAGDVLGAIEQLKAKAAVLDSEPVVEHAIQMSGGSMQVRCDDPEIERIYPLAEWIPANQRFGGHVWRRTVMVVNDWQEVPR